jgi:hypothetical protein
VGLKQNTTLLAQMPLRHLGGAVGTLRPMWGRTDLRNQSVGQGIPSKLAGIPSGHLAPSSWTLPYRPGAMSSFTNLVVTLTPGTLNLAAGRNISGGTTVTVTVNPAAGQLIVSAVGSTSITFNLAANLAGALSASGSTAVTFTVNNATLGAIVDAVGATLVQFSASATPRATGNLSGDITPFTELSPQSLSAAVWEALASAYSTPGSMGELLNSAGSAADPLLGTVEGTLTLRDVQRILLAVAAGDATGLEGSAMVFKSQDGAKDRVEATYSAGERNVTAVDPT